MKRKGVNNRNGGFTMVEMLAVVAILIILLGVSMVSVVRYRDLLKITELDNAAREIYMAAENRAVLLSGARRLNNQVRTAGAEDGGRYYVSKSSLNAELLTSGSIDPALLDGGDFYIVYNLDGGSVTDVFYAEESMAGLVDSGFSEFYAKWAQSRSQRLALKDEMLVGWYNGAAAEGGNFEPAPPEKASLKVMIKNEEELTVTVEYAAPAPAKLTVKLKDKVLALPGSDIMVPAGTGSYTWVLDSLNGTQFKTLGSGVAPGENFTVTATLTPQTPGTFTALTDSDINNSLFQEGSSEGVAYIRCLRHLQNLDAGFSGVTGKTAAMQTDDIRCKDNETYGNDGDGYDFKPIVNSKLTSYNGRTREIRNLYVSGKTFQGPAGLFSKTGGGTDNTPMTFENIRLVNASVTATGTNNSAGALVGSTSDATIKNCWVYWEPDGDVTNLTSLLGSDAGGIDGYRYQIKGANAGGLVGYSKGYCKITGSLAATLVQGDTNTGGLIGNFDGSDITIQYSYADCYLNGRGGGVAGLIGQLENGKSAVLANCYAAGYILEGERAAGLCLGWGVTDATNVYSVLRYPGRMVENTLYFLTQNHKVDTLTNTHFLGKESQQVEAKNGNISSTLYADMVSDGFIGEMGAVFDRKEQSGSHPYNLREHLFLNTYSYPGLNNMPHYGDWGAEFREPSLVYYEEYGDGSWGVSGGNARDLINSLENNQSIRSDGYAVAFLQEDLKAESVTVTYTYLDRDGTQRSSGPHEYGKTTLEKTTWANDEGVSAAYYMIPLPSELVNSDYAQDCFYRYLKFELALGGGGEQPEGEYFFNPHFAETVAPVISDSGSEGGWNKDTATEHGEKLAAAMDEIKIRTPRHLHSLSEFPEYYTRSDTFRQVLDLDYSAYKGYELFQGIPYAQTPIGKYGEAFAGTYNGDYNAIRNVTPAVNETAQRRYAGLFGYSAGTLRNIVYQMNPDHQVTAYLGNSANNLYVGALAGGSSGVVDNCAVSGANLRAGASGVSLYVGGLVGQNQGTIRNCSAEFAQLSANCFNYAKIYIGGLVGENAASRSITTSYAVGAVSAEVDDTITTARICGFVGWNSGSISNSYAAVDLRSSGENVEIFGFCGERAGSQSGTGYLDQGSYTYRGTSYAANYHREGDKAQSLTYARLAGKAEDSFSVPGMGKAVQSPQWEDEEERLYPYPAAVKNKAGAYIHYGRWPEPMPLGEMGVFYWEKLVIDGKETYHLSALAVDPGKNKITRQSNLSETHNDGGVVTDYGYGYYSEEGIANNVAILVENIGYTGYQEYNKRKELLTPEYQGTAITTRKRDKTVRSDKKEIDAEEALSKLIDGYAFHCWNTYREAPRKADNNADNYRRDRTVSGLCLYKKSKDDVLNPNSGTMKLVQTGETKAEVTFIVNPQFADAMSVRNNGGFQVTGGAPGADQSPGTAKNPYQVRCGMQLQDINWYDTAYTDVPVGLGDYTANRFPYLNKDYYWSQTHDIDWVEERKSYDIPDVQNDDGVFFPIAQGYVKDSDTFLTGWFGGTYDGGGYTLKNFDIGLNTKNYQVNCMGLFGVAKGAVLKDIVMFSESGKDTVTVYGRSETKYGDSSTKVKNERNGWYAGGVLVGLAQKGENGKGEITNCAVAGYTIVDQAEYTRKQQTSDTDKPPIQLEFINGTKYVDIGGAIGGLVGMTDMDLTGCMSSVTIELKNTYPASQDGKWNVPLRVGGLVGSTTGSVKNCYTGGIIDTGTSSCEIYAGMITGGVGMVTGRYYDKKEVSINSCYSYMDINPGSGTNVLKYARMNGTYGGTTIRSNNYYLGSTWRTASGEEAITYQELAGKEIYRKLNANQTPAPYSPVTSEIGGLAMAGRFSYAPQNRLDLQGRDYPFPTVLTQTRVSDGMVFNVHYGGWPLNGIERTEGGKPIELDMFTRKTCGEPLKLSTGIPTGGTWTVTGGDGVVEASVIPKPDGTATLTITAVQASDTPVVLTVQYEVEGARYSLPITVYVTDIVELRPSTVSLFPSDVVNVALTPFGVIPGGKEYVELDPTGLTILGATGVNAPVSAEAVMPSESNPDILPGVRLTRGDAETDEKQMRLDVTFTYVQDGYPAAPANQAHRIEVNLPDLPEGKWDENGRVWSMDFAQYAPEELAVAFPDGALEGFSASVSGTSVTLRKVEIDAELPEKVKLIVTLTIDGLTHELTIPIPPAPEPPEP